MSQYFHFTTLTDNIPTQYTIYLNHWQFLANGESHIVLENNTSKDPLFNKVIRICMHSIHSIPHEILDFYDEIINQNATLCKNICHHHKILMEEKDRELLKHYIIDMMKENKEIPSNFQIYLCQNLTKSQGYWTHYLQFKPKTPLPDVYSHKILQKITNNLNISSQQLALMLKDRPLSQKTRWFKKNALKKIKKNHNPVSIFKIDSNLDFKPGELMRSMENRQVQQFEDCIEEKITISILNSLNNSQILTNILKLQMLFMNSNDQVCYDLQQFWSQIGDTKQFLGQTKSKISSELNQRKDVLKQVKDILKQSPCVSNSSTGSIVQNMIRFLISWSWRDISLIFRAKIRDSDYYLEDCDWKIIDFQLKEACKLSKTVVKDQKFLNNYLKYLKII